MAHVALYSPYLPKHSGGGEKYLLSIAEATSKLHRTSILVSKTMVAEMTEALSRYEAIFGLDLSKVEVVSSAIGSGKSKILPLVETKKYSHLFAITDGSIFPSLSKNSYLIVQVPWVRKLSLAEKLKLKTWKSVLVYSEFVRDVLKNSWAPKDLRVLSPYVDLHDFSPSTKEPIILNVGRFFKHSTSNSKRQDVIVDCFKRLVDKGVLTNYSLVLAGNVDPNPDSQEYLNELKAKAFGYHVNIATDLSYKELRSFYARSKFYWHAAGFGVDAQLNPENTEHFGMTTLEAMASECIPLVVPYGGQKEIVNDKGLFWETEDQLFERMQQLTHLSAKELAEKAAAMRARAQKYSKTEFTENLLKLIET